MMPGPTERHFRGTLTERDVKRHIAHVVHLAAAASRVTVLLNFAPAMVVGHRNMICLTIFDPFRFRGAGHRHGDRHAVEIRPAAATPGYLPGPLPAGNWVVQLDTHMVMPGAACRYELAVAPPPRGWPAAPTALADSLQVAASQTAKRTREVARTAAAERRGSD